MNLRHHLVAWTSVVLTAIGIYAIVALSFGEAPEQFVTAIIASDRLTSTPTATSTPTPATTATAQFMPTMTVARVAINQDVSEQPAQQDGPLQMPTPTPRSAVQEQREKKATPSPTVPALALPAVPVPEGGQEYLIVPVQALDVGWAEDQSEEPNKFGDYNIYAGVFDGRTRIGAVRFDLSSIPPGAPIVHADLSLTGLADDWLGTDGMWSVDVLQPWMDDGWAEHNYHWLAREDSVAGSLLFPQPASSLGRGTLNTFYFSAEGLARLQERLFSGKVSFRVTGPATGEDNLFTWDSGFGSGSLGRRPVLRVIAGPAPGEAPPSPTPNYIIVTPVPEDDSILALAAQRLTATAVVLITGDGTPVPIPTETLLPPNWVTPLVVVNTPVPENAATAVWLSQIATAQAIVHGTPTPLPPNAWTATPLPPPPTETPTPDLVAFSTLTPTATPTVTPTDLPPVLRNKILFKTDRYGAGSETLMVMDPDGTDVAIWAAGADDWIFQEAQRKHVLSANGQYQVLVEQDTRYRNFQIFVDDIFYNKKYTLHYMEDMSYDPVISPVEYKVAFVSLASGNDEIYTVNIDGTGLTRLTFNTWEWDKHPTWSPDGSQIAFWSNRDTQLRQIWLMEADGSNPRNISNNTFNDWDPVWVR